MTPDPYRLSDETITALNKLTVNYFDKYKRQLYLAKFDELNVIRLTDRLYKNLDEKAKTWMKDLYILRYEEAFKSVAGKRKDRVELDDDEIDELAEMELANLLEEPDAVTHYAYNAEVMRKRDRLKEALDSVSSQSEREYEIQKAMRFWSQMVAQYCDTTSDAATVKAFQNAGVERVMWHTQKDQRVCGECDELDGKVFSVTALPPKPHWGCRCWITPI